MARRATTTFTISGEYEKLTQWEKLFSSGQLLLEPMNAAMAETVIGLVQEGFVQERDPYGKPWAPKKKPDGRKVLSGETGRLKTGWHPQLVTRRDFIVAPSVEYAAPHQAPKRGGAKGKGRLPRPRRRMVPSSDRGMPAAWRTKMRETALDGLTSFFGGGGTGAKARGSNAAMGYGARMLSAKVGGIKRRLSLRALISRVKRMTDPKGSGT
jgi:hypothetical protein